MRRSWLTVACVILLGVGSQSWAKPKAVDLATDSGVSFTLLQMPGAKEVAIYGAWPTDWAYRRDVNPVSQFVGADLLLSGGARGWTTAEAGEAFSDLKASARIWSTPDYVFGYLTMPEDSLEKAVAITNAHLTSPALHPAWFKRVRDQLSDRLAEFADHPQNLASSALRTAILGNSPLRDALSLDDPASFSSLTVEDVATWHREILVTAGLKLVIAGDLTEAEASEAVTALLDGMPKGSARAAPRLKADFRPRTIVFHTPDAAGATLLMAGPLPPTRKGHELDDLMIVTALGQGDQSILFDVVRTRLRAAYNVSAFLDGFDKEARFLAILGDVDADRADKVIAEIGVAYDKMRESGALRGHEELKATLAAGIHDGSKQPFSASHMALLALLDGMDAGSVLDPSSFIDRTNSATIQVRLQSVFPAASDLIVVVASPDKDVLPGACVITEPKDAVNCP
jgi:predicted Zn-dependent peptidase